MQRAVLYYCTSLRRSASRANVPVLVNLDTQLPRGECGLFIYTF